MPLEHVFKGVGAMEMGSPWWLPGGHLQTIWPALRGRCGSTFAQHARFRRERWNTPDGDFIDVDWQDPQGNAAAQPLLVLFHGLEGSSNSHYAQAFADQARQQGWAFVVPHFRGCSGEINLAPRAYHSGDFEEIGWILQRLRQRSAQPLLAVGVSLGGNALLRWAEEAGSQAAQQVSVLASISAPVDLAASGQALGQGFNRWVYTRMFLATMKPRALQKLAQYPGLFSRQALLQARTLHAFDNVFTAPLHGFKDTADYWHKASAKPHLGRIRVPALLVNARNDPFVPAASLPTHNPSAHVTLWQPTQGGHVGFAHGSPPDLLDALPHAVLAWMASQTHLNLKPAEGAPAHG